MILSMINSLYVRCKNILHCSGFNDNGSRLEKKIIIGCIVKVSLLIFIIINSCKPVVDSKLEFALNAAGDNRIELEKVLEYYKNDSLKLAAANYLISNMPYHYTREEYYVSPYGQKYRPNITSFSCRENVKKHCDSLLQSGYRIEQRSVHDINTLNSAFLINNIELAFSAWQNPWSKQISFNDFCRYILPYRAQTEQISYLRKEIMERFVPILDSINVQTPL